MGVRDEMGSPLKRVGGGAALKAVDGTGGYQRAFAIAAKVRRFSTTVGRRRLVFVPRYSLGLNRRSSSSPSSKASFEKPRREPSTPFPMRSLSISKPSHPPHAQTISQTQGYASDYAQGSSGRLSPFDSLPTSVGPVAGFF